MKILLATPLFPPDSGGPATDAQMLFSELPKHGVEVVVCSFGSVRHLPRLIRHIRYFFELLKNLHDVDMIIAMDTFSVCLPALFASKLLNKKFVVRVPGDFAWEQSTQRFGVSDTIEDFQIKRYGWKVETIRTLQRFAVRRADLVVTISDFLTSIVSQWEIDPARITRVYLGLDFVEEVKMPSNVPQGKILFTLGRFVPWKGFRMLIELMPELPEEWHLVIVGDGPLRLSLERLAEELGVSKRVTFTGVLLRLAALGWYRQANAFVLNTSQETFSFQVLEAMESGIPIITTTVGSIPELITDGVEGVLCAPDDKIAFKEAILSTQIELNIWKQRGEAARHKAIEKFSASASTTAFVHALRRMLPLK
jgi:glycosyltransferase involved in cell wall biosynthesis